MSNDLIGIIIILAGFFLVPGLLVLVSIAQLLWELLPWAGVILSKMCREALKWIVDTMTQ